MKSFHFQGRPRGLSLRKGTGMEMKKHYSLIAGILTVSLLSSGIVPALAGTVEEIERRTHKASIFLSTKDTENSAWAFWLNKVLPAGTASILFLSAFRTGEMFTLSSPMASPDRCRTV